MREADFEAIEAAWDHYDAEGLAAAGLRAGLALSIDHLVVLEQSSIAHKAIVSTIAAALSHPAGIAMYGVGCGWSKEVCLAVKHDGFLTIAIKPVVRETVSPDAAWPELKPWFKDLPFNLTEENMQARARAVILMALSNKFGYILLNTSNKSEAAVGYGTLYGDMCGGISVLGDVYKTQVYELASYINRELEIIPKNSIDKPPSAELRPGQKDSDSLPDYSILDKILYEYIELRKGPNELIREGFDKEIVKRVLKLVNTSEYKRNQTPPILRISPKAFGTGRRMPIVGKYLS